MKSIALFIAITAIFSTFAAAVPVPCECLLCFPALPSIWYFLLTVSIAEGINTKLVACAASELAHGLHEEGTSCD